MKTLPRLLAVALASFTMLSGPVPSLMAKDTDKPAVEEEMKSLIIQFNGEKLEGVAASTGDKAFRPVFEKELARLCAGLPGKPAAEITHWYGVINGAALKVNGGPAGTTLKLMELLQKQPWVKTVELDQKVQINGPAK